MAEIATMAQRLRKIRRTFGLTQENMAAKVNLALSTWQSYEAEVGHKPRSDVLERLVDWGVDADYIKSGRYEIEVKSDASGSVSVQFELGDESLYLGTLSLA